MSVSPPSDPPVTIVDARGHRCPTPTLRLRRALERAPAGGRVRLLADDPLARIDVPHFVRSAGDVLEDMADSPEGLVFTVRKSSPA